MRIRLIALLSAGVILGAGLGIRALAGAGSALGQASGTALYASMVYAGVFVVAPRTRPGPAGIAAVAFCWLVEFAQLTGGPAELSRRSPIARLVLGTQFDAGDLPWYVAGAVPLTIASWAFHSWSRARSGRAAAQPAPADHL